ncbi:hypothetical protein LWI28_025938 [Acer negundo]|uniref:F-box domain-containing protein n=1 Tax=Acer negundo TaxID=4023 RepID=A0AAD5IHB9_ACENE|nr:hypothetical protein LWI28_025938 [Acer negundo]KAK4838185.1 hypothetical protein QYF36_011702 [Acer negundo]
MSSLPQDIIVDILCRIPVKNLLRFRCVSKPWCKLIDGPDFIKLHLAKSTSNQTQTFLILKHSKNLYWVSLDSLESASELDQPLMCYNHCVKVLGSCNGLLCIRNIVDDVAFWNPSTKKHRVLPFLSLERKRYSGNSVCNVCVYGFGYDSVHDDYKLVRVAQFSSVESESRYFESEVKVFSLVRNHWKRIGDMNYVFHYPGTNGVFACGCLHWVVSRNVEVKDKVYNIVVALDLAVEDYKEVALPEFGVNDFKVELGALGEYLCVVSNHLDIHTDVWVMKEYGVMDSWTKLFSIAREQVGGYFGYIRPLGYANKGKEVLFQRDKSDVFLYDVNKKIVKNVRIRGSPISYKVNICVQSLVSFNVYDGRKQIDGEDKKNLKKRDDFLSEGFKLVL